MDDQEQGSERTGSQRRLSQILPEIRDSIRLRREIVSETTGLPSPERQDESSTGKRHGGTGVALRPDASTVLAKAFELPAGTLAHSLEPLLEWRETSLYGSHGFEGVRIEDVKIWDGATRAQVLGLLKSVEAVCMPCDAKFAAQKLSELRVLTAHRARDGSDVELLAAAYTHRLAEYPADVVDMACNRWADANPFWPTWAELKNELDKRMKGRKQIHAALRAAVS